LQSLLDTAKGKVSSVKNVEPFGKQTSTSIPLTRDILENAASFRKWFLDLKHVESGRERAPFVDGVLKGFASLPDLPPRAGKSGKGTQSKDELVGTRVEALSTFLKDNTVVLNQQRELLDNSPSDQLLEMEDPLGEMLATLRKIPVVSVEEEMAIVRKDVFAWLMCSHGSNVPKRSSAKPYLPIRMYTR